MGISQGFHQRIYYYDYYENMDWDVKTGKVLRGKVRGIMFIFCGLGDMDLEFENGVTDLKSYFLL